MLSLEFEVRRTGVIAYMGMEQDKGKVETNVRV